MTTAQGIPVVLPPLDASVKKMEDRKRSLANDADDLAPSRKRMIKDENGQQMRMDAEKEKDVEVCYSPSLRHASMAARESPADLTCHLRTTKKMPSYGR